MAYGCYSRDTKIVNYFHTLFTTSSQQGNMDFLEVLHGKVLDNMNSDMLREFTIAEVKEALLQMNPTTTPGPDGMPPLFYQKY